MQPETHPAETAVAAPASDLLPPQRRKGVPRITAILGVGLLAAATFLAGIEAQKQWGGGDSGSSGGFAAARAAAAAGGNPTERVGNDGAAGPGAGGVFARRGGGFTSGTVKLVKGSTLYVTTADGNTVKVSVPKSSTITKSVTAKVSAIKPGDTVTAIGASSNGVVKATSVRVGDTGLPVFRSQGAAQGP